MLIIVRGLPGSGKSTYVRNNYPDLLHVENDMYFIRDGGYFYSKDEINNAISFCSDIVELALENYADVVVSNTFTKKSYVDFYVNKANLHHTEYKVIRLETKYESIHNVPKEVYENMKNSFEDYPGEIIIE